MSFNMQKTGPQEFVEKLSSNLTRPIDSLCDIGHSKAGLGHYGHEKNISTAHVDQSRDIIGQD